MNRSFPSHLVSFVSLKSQMTSEADVAMMVKITGGRSLKEEIGKNWPNLPTSATLGQILAWPSLIFGIPPILHETDG